MEKKISIIGGDLRLVYLAELFQMENLEVYTYGLERSNKLQNNKLINKCNTLEECMQSSNLVISSIPFSQDNIYVKESYSENKIMLEEVASYIDNKTFIAGSIPQEFYRLIENKSVKILDLMKSEELAILNSISTAEGAIKVAIEEKDTTIHGSNILILGFGRIGKVLAKMLSGMEANLYCEARKQEDLAWIETYGYKKVPLNELDKSLSNYDIVFNTIPSIILDKEKLKLLKKETLIIDLASKPGGVDMEAAKDLNLKAIWATSLPGKVAPKSAAQIIKQTIEHESR